jgi:hypothetical protein
MFKTEVKVCNRNIHCKKKVSDFSVPSLDVNNQTLPGRELCTVFPDRESLVSDIPAGDGKITNLFLQCTSIRTVRVQLNIHI